MDFSSLLSFLGPLGGMIDGATSGDVGGGMMKSMDPLGSMLGFNPLSMMMGGGQGGQQGAAPSMQGALLKQMLGMPQPMTLGMTNANTNGPQRNALGG